MSKEEIKEESFSSDEEFDDADDADSESSSDADAKVAEDDVFDIEFLKCYSALKKKDDKIYDKNTKFFTEEASDSDREPDTHYEEGKSLLGLNKAKAPKMTLLDHQLSLHQTDLADAELSARPKVSLLQQGSQSYYEKELEEIKKSIEKIGEGVNSDSDDELLLVKNPDPSKANTKRVKKIDTYLDKLEEESDEDISHLKQIWTDPDQLTDEDKFLRDYIMNKRYLPTNQEDSGKDGHFSKNLEELSDVEEESEEKKSENLINHHSEEKDFEKISRVPRNSTKTIRDLKEKREKREKRLKKLEKEKNRKKALKDADCEDIVGDLPTRFHYRETEPNDYGLSAVELLMATDEELESWVALKDAIKYKTPEEELSQKERFEQKRHDLELKKKIFKSVYGDTEEDGDVSMANSSTNKEEVKTEKTRKRKRKQAHVEADESTDQQEVTVEESKEVVKESNASKRKRKHKRGLNHKKFAKSGVAPDRLLAYGLSKTKLKKSKLL